MLTTFDNLRKNKNVESPLLSTFFEQLINMLLNLTIEKGFKKFLFIDAKIRIELYAVVRMYRSILICYDVSAKSLWKPPPPRLFQKRWIRLYLHPL